MAGMVPPVFFICANIEDNANGIVVDAISGTEATLVGSVGFGVNFKPNIRGVDAPPLPLPVIQLPQGAGLSFSGIPLLVPQPAGDCLVGCAVKLNGARRADPDYTNPSTPTQIDRTLVTRTYRNPGGSNTALSGWYLGAKDYKNYWYDQQFLLQTSTYRPTSATTQRKENMSTPWSANWTTPHLLDSLLPWYYEMCNTSQSAASWASISNFSTRPGYQNSTGAPKVTLPDTDDRPLLIGCARDFDTDTYYTKFLDGELLFLAVWAQGTGFVPRGESDGGGDDYYSYLYDPVEMFRRLAKVMDGGGGTQPVYFPRTHYVSDTEAGSYPILDYTMTSIPAGTRLFVDGTLVETVRDFPSWSGDGTQSQTHATPVADLPDAYYHNSSKLYFRQIPRGSEDAPAFGVGGVRATAGDTIIIKSTHTYSRREFLRGPYTNNPLNVVMLGALNANDASVKMSTSGFVNLTSVSPSPPRLALEQLNGKLTGYHLGAGRGSEVSLWSAGITNLFDSVIKPRYYWSESDITVSTIAQNADYDTVNSSTVALRDAFGVTSPESRRSLNMYGGMLYGATGLMGPGSIGSVMRLFGVNTVHASLRASNVSGYRGEMPVSASVFSSPGKITKLGGIASLPVTTDGRSSVFSGTASRYSPSFVSYDNLTPRGATTPKSASGSVYNGTTTSAYRTASPARLGTLPYSWRISLGTPRDRLSYTPFVAKFVARTAGTAVRINVAGLTSDTVRCLSIRVAYTRASTGAKAVAAQRASAIILNSIASGSWIGVGFTTSYIDVPCPDMGVGPVTVVIRTQGVYAVAPDIWIDPYVGVV